MSRFFCTSSSTSSSNSEADGEVNDETQDISRDAAVGHATGGPPAMSANESAPLGLSQGDILHALLEERCMNQVLGEHAGRHGRIGRDDANVQAEARARYERLCSMLAPHNLISPGMDRGWQSPVRQQIRNGLDLYSRTTSLSQQQTLPRPVRKLLTTSEIGHSSAGGPPLGPAAPAPGSLLDAVNPSHPLLEPSRYRREFEEIGLLGRGGYGVVYHVKNRLDGQPYAIKKIPISAARLQRVNAKGQQELDELLLELRTLARLDHPHIVRYFAGWLDFSHDDRNALHNGRSPSDLIGRDWTEPQVVAGAKDDDVASKGRVIDQSNLQNTNVMFEDDSRSQRTTNDETFVDSTELDISTSSEKSVSLSERSGPALALHIQMGLYPLNLADFISPPSTSIAPLAHCFHLEPSIDILMAILEGVEYLHSQGIVHRDLKPANIFLGANSNPHAADCGVDLFLCSVCRAHGTANPVNLSVRIGDFGLVTSIARPESDCMRDMRPVGTEVYRPATMTASSSSSPSLDIFAIAVIAFELLWRFGTRMERHDTLQRLKRGTFPLTFSKSIGEQTDRMQRCIENMLAMHHEHVKLSTLKGQLLEIRQSVRYGEGRP